MTYKTHLLGGAAAAVDFILLASENRFGLEPLSVPAICGVFTASMIGGLSPDIDLQNSKVGKTLKPVSAMANGLVGHRTFFHSLLFLLIVLYLTDRFVPSMCLYALAFCAGAASHLLLDMLNEPGVPLLWPIKIRFRIAKIKTESISNSKRENRPERIFRTVLGVLVLFMTINMGKTIL